MYGITPERPRPVLDAVAVAGRWLLLAGLILAYAR